MFLLKAQRRRGDNSSITAVLLVLLLVLLVSVMMADRVQAATAIVRPNADITTQWGPGGASDGTCSGAHCARVDEAIPNTTDFIETPILLGGNLTELFDMETASIGQRATQVVIRTYARSGFALPPLDAIDTITPSLWIAGGYIVGGEITPNYPSWAWFDTVFTGNWSQAEIDAMRVRYVNNIKGLGLVQNNLKIATTEAVVTYTPDASVAQSAYRTYQNADSAIPGLPLGAQNTAVDIPGGGPFRLRVGLDVSSNQLMANSYMYKLQYAQKSGVCDSGFSGEIYNDVTASGPIHWYDNPSVASGAPITAYSGSDPASGNPIVFQSYHEGVTFTNSLVVNVGSTGLWDLALASDTQTVGSYCLRIVRSDGQLLSAYAIVPEVVITGSLDIDLVDTNGLPSSLPIQFSNVLSGTSCQVSTGVMGTNLQRIRITNNSPSPGWTASLAPEVGLSAAWSDGIKRYDLNDLSGCIDGGDADVLGGSLTVNPVVGMLTPHVGCSAIGVAKGSAATFSEGTVDAIAVVAASGSAERFCSWSLTGVALTQFIPMGQPAGVYSTSMVLTILNS